MWPRPVVQPPAGCYIRPMSNPFYYLIPFAIGALFLVLLAGLVNMFRGGSPHTSQKLMRLRVVLQFIALVIIMLAIWMMGR
jgi:hypothetical protein